MADQSAFRKWCEATYGRHGLGVLKLDDAIARAWAAIYGYESDASRLRLEIRWIEEFLAEKEEERGQAKPEADGSS